MAAAGALLFHFENDRVLITVGPNVFDHLSVAGGRALMPELLAAAAEINRLTDFERLAE